VPQIERICIVGVVVNFIGGRYVSQQLANREDLRKHTKSHALGLAWAQVNQLHQPLTSHGLHIRRTYLSHPSIAYGNAGSVLARLGSVLPSDLPAIATISCPFLRPPTESLENT
jgi:hypothetical protein